MGNEWVGFDDFLRARAEPDVELMWCLRCRRMHVHRQDPLWMGNGTDSWQCLTCCARRTGPALTEQMLYLQQEMIERWEREHVRRKTVE